jgi:uncharacterized membrane protein YfcA
MLAWAATALCAILTAGAMTIGQFSGSYTILAIPAGLFVVTVLLPVIFAALVFLHASRQELADRKSGLSER